MTWKGERQRHSLVSRGISTQSIVQTNSRRGVTKKETFTYIASQWNVYKAAKLIEDEPRKIEYANIDALFEQITKSKKTNEGYTVTPGVGINWEYVETLTKEDCKRPGIVVQLNPKYGTGLLIDGWHRVAACKKFGIKQYPIYVLTDNESQQIAMNEMAEKIVIQKDFKAAGRRQKPFKWKQQAELEALERAKEYERRIPSVIEERIYPSYKGEERKEELRKQRLEEEYPDIYGPYSPLGPISKRGKRIRQRLIEEGQFK